MMSENEVRAPAQAMSGSFIQINPDLSLISERQHPLITIRKEKARISTIGVRGTGPGCGKDTVADWITVFLKKKGIQTHRSAFANSLRQEVFRRTGIPVEVLRTVEGKNMIYKPTGETIGQILQKVGAGMKALWHPLIWVEDCMRSLPDNGVSIISDVRYKDEQNAVKKRDGYVILVTSNRPADPRLMAGRSLQHSSERDLDGVLPDFTIENNGTLEELEYKVKVLVDRLYP